MPTESTVDPDEGGPPKMEDVLVQLNEYAALKMRNGSFTSSVQGLCDSRLQF
jgi:hypothetical protein